MLLCAGFYLRGFILTPRVALVGAGSIADYHLAGLHAAGAPAVAVASRTLAAAQGVAGAHGVPEALDDWRRLLDRRNVDAVIVATPDATHRELACAFLSAGKAVLLQKPMAPTAAEAVLIRDAARASGAVLEVSFMHRHFTEVVRASAMLAEGELGEVLSARVRNATPGPDWTPWFWRRAGSGGVAAQIGVHGIDLVRHLLSPITSVAALGARRVPVRTMRDGTRVESDVEDHVAAAYLLHGGAAVAHEMSFSDTGVTDRFAMEVHGARGTLAIRGPRGVLALHQGGAWWDVAVPADEPGRRQHAEFLDIVAGRRPPSGSDADGLAAQRVIEALAESVATGRRVEVPP